MTGSVILKILLRLEVFTSAGHASRSKENTPTLAEEEEHAEHTKFYLINFLQVSAQKHLVDKHTRVPTYTVVQYIQYKHT